MSGVESDLGPVSCEYFVNCAGFWARGVGQLSEPYVKVPLHAVEHYYLHTKPIPGLDPMTPGSHFVYNEVYYYIFQCLQLSAIKTVIYISEKIMVEYLPVGLNQWLNQLLRMGKFQVSRNV